MITLTANIGLEADGEILELQSNIQGNNVSSTINDILNKKTNRIGNPFILGKSILGNGDYYVSDLPYYLGTEVANADGIFTSAYIITVNSDMALNHIFIEFDKAHNQYPNSIIVDGKTIADDDPQYEIVFDEKSTTHTIQINNWNTPNSPLVIAGIYSDKHLDISANCLISVRGILADRDSENYPTFGVISNGGSLTILDQNEEILDLIDSRVFHSNISIDIFENITLPNNEIRKEQVRHYKVQNLTYDNDNRQINMRVSDDLTAWQDINVSAINYNPLNPQTQPFSWLYKILYNVTPLEYNMLSYEELDDITKSVLDDNIIQYPLLEASNLWDEWDKLCKACLLHIYINEKGRVVCKYKNGK